MFGPPTTSDDPRATQLRKCGKCGADAVTCHHVTIHRVNGLPAGRTYAHRCQQCKREFQTISLWRTISDGIWSVFTTLFGLIIAPLLTYSWVWERRGMGVNGWEWVGLVVLWGCAIGGPLWMFSIAKKTYRLFENPVARR